MTSACLGSQLRTELCPAQPQLLYLYFHIVYGVAYMIKSVYMREYQMRDIPRILQNKLFIIE